MRLLQQQNPEVYEYLTTVEPDKALLDGQDETEAPLLLRLETRDEEFSLIQLCSFLGQIRHIQALELSEAQYKEAVKRDDYAAIRYAAEKGHLDTIKYLEGYLSDEEKKAAIEADFYAAIRYAAQNGHLDTVQYLERNLRPEEKKIAVIAYSYSTIQYAAEGGHLEAIQYLEAYLSPEEKIAAVKADSYAAIQYAADGGDLETLQYLESHLSPQEQKAAVEADDYAPIRCAAELNRVAIIQHFLNTQECAFFYMEAHDMEFGARYVYPWVAEQIARLRQAQMLFQEQQPTEVFTVSEPQARRHAQMIMNLICRGVARDYADAEDVLDDLRFLLSIPGVRALCHLPLSESGQENELLRLAMRIGNEEVAGILLGIPEVRQRAEQHEYYRQEAAGAVDLAALARDRESSMVALSVSERKTVETVSAHYRESIARMGGTEALFLELKNYLKAHYTEHPATIALPTSDEGLLEEIALPFEWGELQALREALTPEQYALALEAYHRHDVHTAYRYLSKPNYWMAEGAAYVCVYYDAQNQPTSLRYSTFEEYQHLIALFYLAASDATMPALEGHTVASRVECFVKQLALIGRAHNWDGSREVSVNGRRRDEEYDNTNEGDRPSCYSGVNRRLFQSVLGHGLFMTVTYELMKQALHEQVADYFNQVLNQDNATAIKEAYEGLVGMDDDMGVHQEVLSRLDILEARKSQMIEAVAEQLTDAFQSKFTADRPAFIFFMREFLNRPREYSCDFVRFVTPLSLDRVLEANCRKALKRKHGFFPEAPDDDPDDAPDDAPDDDLDGAQEPAQKRARH